MIQVARATASAAVVALIASRCGGAGVAPPAAQSAATTVTATATRAVVAASGQGATSAKLTENKVVIVDGAAPDLAPTYLATVSLVTLEKGGRTVAHKHGGLESIYVLQGTVDFRTAGGGRQLLTRGQGASAPPGTALQAVNAGEGPAKFLAFFMTAESAPFQTNVDEAP